MQRYKGSFKSCTQEEPSMISGNTRGQNQPATETTSVGVYKENPVKQLVE